MRVPVVVSLIVIIVIVVFAVSGMINYSKSTGSYVVRAPQAVLQPLSETTQRAVMPPYHDCYDSDGGKNYYEKGTTIVDGYYWTDVCDSKGDLVENFCLYGVAGQPQRSLVIFTCHNGCSKGQCNPYP